MKPSQPLSKPIVLDVPVRTESRNYPVFIGRGMLRRIGTELRKLHGPTQTKVAVVSESHILSHYGEIVQQSLEEQGFTVKPMTMDGGEANKNISNLLAILEQMLQAEMGRRDILIALGGGVVGDLAGLAAALFMRGISLIQCPTSLLAQVDASVGGKVALDLPQAKNVMGAFHFPLAVFMDPDVLSTLPDQEIACGLAEMLKHGMLFSTEHFQQVVQHADAIYARNFDLLAPLLATSVALKSACVGRDPWEQGSSSRSRVLLNLGHTIGHAIEAVSGYTITHGYAVGLGLRAAARISQAKKLTDAGLEALVTDALTKLRLYTDLDSWLIGDRGREVERALLHDKKCQAGYVSYVALANLADPKVINLTPSEIMQLLRA